MIRGSRAEVMTPKVELLFSPFAPAEKLTFGLPRFRVVDEVERLRAELQLQRVRRSTCP